jgi:hypothetical protein
MPDDKASNRTKTDDCNLQNAIPNSVQKRITVQMLTM